MNDTQVEAFELHTIYGLGGTQLNPDGYPFYQILCNDQAEAGRFITNLTQRKSFCYYNINIVPQQEHYLVTITL